MIIVQVFPETELRKTDSVKEVKIPYSKPVTICGWCGAVEVQLSNGRTECPNCDEYLH